MCCGCKRDKTVTAKVLPDGTLLSVERRWGNDGFKVVLVHTSKGGARAGCVIDPDSFRLVGSSIEINPNNRTVKVRYGNKIVTYDYVSKIMTNHNGDAVEAGTGVL
jgi:hypothetical protein